LPGKVPRRCHDAHGPDRRPVSKERTDDRETAVNAMRAAGLALALGLAGCSLVSLSDRYGNTYGDWYNPGQQYGWQLATCDQEVAAGTVAAPGRKLAMRCCMWRHGVPIDDPDACQAPAG
jgi:hypothetical protein